MMCLALGTKCGGRGESGLASGAGVLPNASLSAISVASAIEPTPNAHRPKKWRRVRRRSSISRRGAFIAIHGLLFHPNSTERGRPSSTPPFHEAPLARGPLLPRMIFLPRVVCPLRSMVGREVGSAAFFPPAPEAARDTGGKHNRSGHLALGFPGARARPALA